MTLLTTRPAEPGVVERALAALHSEGVAIIPDVLTLAEASDAFQALWAASDESQHRGVPAHIVNLDPNASNVRVFNLIDLDPRSAPAGEAPKSLVMLGNAAIT